MLHQPTHTHTLPPLLLTITPPPSPSHHHSFPPLLLTITPHPLLLTITQSHKGNKRGKVSRADLEQCRLALESQTHVCETLERERDQANDDYEFAQVS